MEIGSVENVLQDYKCTWHANVLANTLPGFISHMYMYYDW